MILLKNNFLVKVLMVVSLHAKMKQPTIFVLWK